jgi:glycosidase
VKELHEIGIKVVLDGVFNHTGKGHFAFQDLMVRGCLSFPNPTHTVLSLSW